VTMPGSETAPADRPPERPRARLEARGRKTFGLSSEGIAKAVDDVSLTVHEGEVLGVVGESGCGKSVTALSVLRLIPWPPGRIVAGEILFSDRGDLTKLDAAAMKEIRGNEISMIFQEPMTSLNPVFRVGDQIAEAVQIHQNVSKSESHRIAVELARRVGIPSPEKRVKDYPHQLSGGMRQRIMIAMALSCRPKLMLADEPTTALDVTIQAQVLDVMSDLRNDLGTAIMLITHDLGVIAEMAQNVVVMYAGVVVERADVRTLFAAPLHPYTQGLLASIPRTGRHAGKKVRLNTIAGMVPSLLDLPRGCRFQDRCPHVPDPCRRSEPPLAPPDGDEDTGHAVRCWLHRTPPDA